MLMIPTGATCLIRLDRFVAVKKASDIDAETTIMIRNIRSVLYLMRYENGLFKWNPI